MAIRLIYRDTVACACARAGDLGGPSALSFNLDAALLAGNWAALTHALNGLAGVRIDPAMALDIGSTVAMGAGGYVARTQSHLGALMAMPGAGHLAAAGVNSVLFMALTYGFARGVIREAEAGHFDQPHDSRLADELVVSCLMAPDPRHILDILRLRSHGHDSALFERSHRLTEREWMNRMAAP